MFRLVGNDASGSTLPSSIAFSAPASVPYLRDSLYEAFEPGEARRILERLEFHFTPKHGSWLNMAEIELNVLSSQCLDRRIPDQKLLVTEVAAWETQRNQHASTVNWQFTTADARIKLRKLYPSFHA